MTKRFFFFESRKMTFQQVKNLWGECLDEILKYMTPEEISSYAKVDKENLGFVQNYMKRVFKSYKGKDYGIIVKDDEIYFKIPHKT